jgi:histone deacetylase 11
MPIDKGTTDEEYIKLVESVSMDFQYFKPEFVIYNAGTDILDEDPLGALHLA